MTTFTRSHVGEHTVPPTRLCLCGHNYSVHTRGPCGMSHQGCVCGSFQEDRNVPKLTFGVPARLSSDAYGHRRREALSDA